MDYYQEAQAVANVFNHPVGIYKTGTDDARYSHWEWRGPDASGNLLPGYQDIVYPHTANMSAVDCPRATYVDGSITIR